MIPPVEFKFCKRCERDRPPSMFGRNRSSSDGKAFYCRDCFAAIARERRAEATRIRNEQRLALQDVQAQRSAVE